MLLQHPLAALAKQCQVDRRSCALAASRPGDRLEEQVDRRAALQAASCVVMWARQHACVGIASASIRRSSAAQDRRDGLDRLGRRIDADHRVAAAEQQAVDGRQQDAAEVVGRVVRLHADRRARRARPSCCGSA